MLDITCPHCGFSKQIDEAALPPRVNKGTCPRCRESFPLQRAATADRPVVAGQVRPDESAAMTTDSQGLDPKLLPKAGFWIRFIATILDGFLVFLLQAGLGGVLYLAGALNGSTGEDLGLLVEVFTLILSIFYYIFFTGYCGQTPGKMAMRIKVVRCDGSPLTYGRAAFRELPAKFISGIILGIGYLMAAFDEHKQALHDRMAKTYVIKL